jgi:hypothetical protein
LGDWQNYKNNGDSNEPKNYRPIGKKVKTHTSQGIVKNKGTKPTKEWLDVAI